MPKLGLRVKRLKRYMMEKLAELFELLEECDSTEDEVTGATIWRVIVGLL